MNSRIHFADRRSATIIAAFAVECPCRHQCFEPQLLHDKSGYSKRPRPPKRFRKDGKESYLEIKDRSKWSDRRGRYRRRTRLNSASDWGRNSWWHAWPYSTQMRYCWKCDHEYLYCASGYADHQWSALPPRDDCEDAQCVNCDAVTSDAVFTCGTETPHEPGAGDRSMCRRCGNRIHLPKNSLNPTSSSRPIRYHNRESSHGKDQQEGHQLGFDSRKGSPRAGRADGRDAVRVPPSRAHARRPPR